jgi:hypothetical protein
MSSERNETTETKRPRGFPARAIFFGCALACSPAIAQPYTPEYRAMVLANGMTEVNCPPAERGWTYSNCWANLSYGDFHWGGWGVKNHSTEDAPHE